MTITRRYAELSRLETFKDRFEYLVLNGSVGIETFGFDRYLNQAFYQSAEWRNVRQDVIYRDRGCDLGIEGRPINGGLVVHHMNPISVEDIINKVDWILNPEFLICVTNDTHQAIHYGDFSRVKQDYTPRRPGDTKLW